MSIYVAPSGRRTRKDKIENLSKVTKVLLRNPGLSREEVAKEAGVHVNTVYNKLDMMEEHVGKDPRIIAITNKDLEIVELAMDEIRRRLKSPEELEVMPVRDIVAASAESTKRYTIFKGDMTDKEGGMKRPTLLTDEEKKGLMTLLGK